MVGVSPFAVTLAVGSVHAQHNQEMGTGSRVAWRSHGHMQVGTAAALVAVAAMPVCAQVLWVEGVNDAPFLPVACRSLCQL